MSFSTDSERGIASGLTKPFSSTNAPLGPVPSPTKFSNSPRNMINYFNNYNLSKWRMRNRPLSFYKTTTHPSGTLYSPTTLPASRPSSRLTLPSSRKLSTFSSSSARPSIPLTSSRPSQPTSSSSLSSFSQSPLSSSKPHRTPS